MEEGAQFSIQMSPDQRASFKAALLEDFKLITNSLVRMDVQQAQAKSPEC